MALIYSPEQERIFTAKQGGYIFVANAGTGKTTSTAELVVRRYLDEERAMFGSVSEHVVGDRQRQLLRQFLCVTFTVKAAAGLDQTIKELFVERGIPIPLTRDGKPYRISRTLDSYLQSWLRKPDVFKAWMQTDPDIHDRAKAVLALLPEATRLAIGCDGRPAHDVYSFSNSWSWIAGNDVSSMLLDLCFRHEEQSGLDGCNVNVWGAAFNDMIAGVGVNERKAIVHDFWAERLGRWNAHQDAFKLLDHDLMQGKEYAVADHEKVVAQILSWDRFNGMRDEFMAVQELARARGYHPEYAPERVTARSIEEQLASGEHLRSYRLFLSVSKRWNRLKTHFLLREFGDQTTAFVRACETYPELMERSKEYPRILRPKNVFWDEVQDNSDFQHRILRLFYGKGVPFLSVAIGDPKQQIYCWRGASPRGFLEMIERKRKSAPENIVGLTCSFRSAKKIVALGNEIVQTLPSYKENVLPSTTIFNEEGHIEVSKPFITLDEEAEWAIDHIEYRLAKTKDKIMVVSRTDISDHPLYFRHLKSHPELNKRVSCLTIHRAKGLEAETVIVLGLVAGKLPDYRANSDEEVNLFYVACTRARHTLLLSGLIAKRAINDAGKIEDTVVGPSPFFSKLPTLKALCLAAGWTPAILRSGLDAHNQLLAVHLSRIDAHRVEIHKERHLLFPQVDVRGENRDPISDYGAAQPLAGVDEMKRLDMDRKDAPNKGGNMVSSRLRERVLEKLIRGHRMLPDRLPRLSSDEWSIAQRSGWIQKGPTDKNWSFAPSLVTRAASAGVAA